MLILVLTGGIAVVGYLIYLLTKFKLIKAFIPIGVCMFISIVSVLSLAICMGLGIYAGGTFLQEGKTYEEYENRYNAYTTLIAMDEGNYNILQGEIELYNSYVLKCREYSGSLWVGWYFPQSVGNLKTIE